MSLVLHVISLDALSDGNSFDSDTVDSVLIKAAQHPPWLWIMNECRAKFANSEIVQK